MKLSMQDLTVNRKDSTKQQIKEFEQDKLNG